MADIVTKKISELTAATELGRTDLLVVQQGQRARALPAGSLQDYCKKGAEQIEANVQAALERAQAAQFGAEEARVRAEGARVDAENIASRVESTAESVAQNAAREAAAQATGVLSGYVDEAKAEKNAAESAKFAAESAEKAARTSASLASTARVNAETAVANAQAAASVAKTASDDAISYSNKSLNSANNAKMFSENAAVAAAKAAESAELALGKNVNWVATKVVTGGDTVIPETTLVFTTSFLSLGNYSGNLVVGNTYIVKWRGTEYECVCKSGDGNYIGNGALAGEPESDAYPFCIMQYSSTACLVFKESASAASIPISVIGKRIEHYSKLPDEHLPESFPYIILRSSNSSKQFKLTVNNSGTLDIVEVT